MRASLRPILGVLVLCGPMTTGLHVDAEGGVGNYEFGGCTGQEYNVKSQSLAASVRVQTEAGFTATVEGAMVPGSIRSSHVASGSDHVGESVTRGSGDARVGWNWRYGGLDAGVGVWSQNYDCCGPDNALVSNSRLNAFPAFSGWAGVPRYAYAWLGVLSEQALLPVDIVPPVFVGLGHQDDLLDLRAGIGGGLIFRGNIKLHRNLQPGVDLRYVDDHHWAAALNLRFSFDVFGTDTY